MIPVDCPHCAWPWLLERDESFRLAAQDLPTIGVNYDRDDPEEWEACRPRLGGRAARQWGHHVTTSLRLK